MGQEQEECKEIPTEIKSKILLNLAQVKVPGATNEQKLYNAIANVRAFMGAFPQFYTDESINRGLIQELTARYMSGDVIRGTIRVAIALATSGAGQWLVRYVGNDQRKIKQIGFSLIHASENGDLGTVRFILKYFPQVINITDNAGETALIRASLYGHTAVVQELLKVGSAVNVQNLSGWTAIMAACQEGYIAIVERLLQVLGINVNLQNRQGYTALISRIVKLTLD